MIRFIEVMCLMLWGITCFIFDMIMLLVFILSIPTSLIAYSLYLTEDRYLLCRDIPEWTFKIINKFTEKIFGED